MTEIRVLVENADEAVLWACERSLSRAGFTVSTCAGPSARNRCTLTAHGHCTLADQADVIVNGLSARDQDVFASQLELLPDTPVVLNLNSVEVDKLGPAAASVPVVSRAVNAAKLADAVARAAAGAEPPAC